MSKVSQFFGGGIFDALASFLAAATPISLADAGTVAGPNIIKLGEGPGLFEAIIEVASLTVTTTKEIHIEIRGGDSDVGTGVTKVLAAIRLGGNSATTGRIDPASAPGTYRIVFRNEAEGKIYGYAKLYAVATTTGVAVNISEAYVQPLPIPK